MAYKYGHRMTAYNGVFKHVFSAYPKAKYILGFYEGIPSDKKNCMYNPKGFHQFMKDYRLSVGSNPSKDPHKNAQFIQNDFQSFINYCKQNLKQTHNEQCTFFQ